MKIGCRITPESSKVISENMRYMKKVKELNLSCKNENKIGNYLGDDGCCAIFNNSVDLKNLERLYLYSNKIKNKNREWNNRHICINNYR